VGWVRAQRPLRDGLDESGAADVARALTSPEIHHLLLDVRGWVRARARARTEEWVVATLALSLLPLPDEDGHETRR